MPRLHYTKPHHLAALHDALLAAGVTVERVEGRDRDIWISVPDDVTEAAVAAVVAAHDAAAVEAQRTTEEEQRQSARQLVTDFLSAPSPTLAQTVTVVKALIRLAMRMLR